MAGRLGDILVDQGHISDQQLHSALNAQGSERGMLGAILLRRGLISYQQLGAALEVQFEVPFREIAPQSVNPQVVRMLPESLARSRCAVPIGVKDSRMTLAMMAPDDIETISEAELITGYQVEPVVALEGEVYSTIDTGFDDRIVARQTIVDMKIADLKEADEVVGVDIKEESEDELAPVVRLVDAILTGAMNASASDIHLEPHTPEMRVRYRVDGELQQVMTIPDQSEEAVVARIKVMGDMDTTENRRPQDGHLVLDQPGIKVNFRVSTIPTVAGEKVVLRLLDEGNKIFDLDHMGMAERERDSVQRLIDKPHGMIVVTGPTGSGKSTTMYAMLTHLNSVKRNIVTVEDPVEYRLPGINQIHSDNEFGLGFSNALKYIMRQDPDVILVGEIRDAETAATAVQAALTGHLLISTLHTNDAVGAIARLNDLGIDAFKTGGALLGSIAQRLLRSICTSCMEPVTPNEAMLKAISKGHDAPPNTEFFHGHGCKKCLGTGFSGRFPVFEVLTITAPIAEAIERGAPTIELRELAIKEGLVELSVGGFNAAVQGRTTIEEAFYKTTT
jgi:type IV pilus assembly protein PilB